MQIYSQPYSRKTGRLHVTLTRKSDRYVLSVQSPYDRPETLYRLCAVLFVYDWTILHAHIHSLSADYTKAGIKDSFLIRPVEGHQVDELKFGSMMADLEMLLFEQPVVSEYIQSRHGSADFTATGHGDVLFELDGHQITTVTEDRHGIAMEICRIFVEHGLDIHEARLHTDVQKHVRDTFLIDADEKRLHDASFRERLRADLMRIL
ncbi:MAG: hypothetical protein KDK30_10465 [Leptospiraceae bacterium]|nr:hypothetical protein [Leptospiraceae bacterium]MCB1321045.1 hypothetical protein [Leptospiraceae bacterium]